MFKLLTERQFPAVIRAPAAARAFVAAELRPHAPETIDIAVLITSELATNVISHAPRPFSVKIFLAPQVVRIEVVDSSSALPIMSPLSDHKVGGRGLHIMNELADSWGVDELHDPEGKSVWFALSRGGSPTA